MTILKKTILACGAIALCSFAPQQQHARPKDEAPLKGKVKTVTEYDRHMVDGMEQVRSVYIRAYDKHGNETADTAYAHDGSMKYTSHSYKYNNAGIKTEQLSYNDDGSINEHTLYLYNKEGRLAETKKYNGPQELPQRVVYRYDAQGNNTVRKDYNAKGELADSVIFSYDPKGLLLSTSSTKGINTGFTYDDNGNLVKNTINEANGWETNILNSSFDEHGNPGGKTYIYKHADKEDTAWYRMQYTYY